MLSWAATFLIIALVAGAVGMTGVAGAAAGIAQTLFVIFLVLFAGSLIMGLIAGRKVVKTVDSHRKAEPRHLIHK